MFSFQFSKSDKTAAAADEAPEDTQDTLHEAPATPAANPQQLLEAVLRSGVLLPVPGPALIELQRIAADENSGPRKIAAVVERDPGMVGAILRVVNSPVFRTRTPPVTAFEAVSRLGRTKTIAIATSESLRAHSEGMDPAVVERLWSCSAQAADWAYWLATHSRLHAIADVAYLTAVLHDVGVAVQLRRLPEHTALFRDLDKDIEEAALELDTLSGTPHATVGALVLRNWKLPAVVVNAVLMHHTPGLRVESPISLRLACLIAAAHKLEGGAPRAWEEWAGVVRTELGLDEAALDFLGAERDQDAD